MGRLGNNLFQWAYLYKQVRLGNIPNIYLQSEDFFTPFQDEIKAILQEGLTYTPKVAVHVRRGDYVNNPFYVDLTKKEVSYDLGGETEYPSYYERAMKHFNGSFLVFSDDIEWCKKQEQFKGCEFSEGLSEEDDFNRMASCADHIIANSSFSWWAAYICPHTGLTIAPKKWHRDGIERTQLPLEWLQI